MRYNMGAPILPVPRQGNTCKREVDMIMLWLILLIILVVLCALVLFLVAPSAGRKDLRTPFAGRNFAHRGYYGKDQCPPENSLPAFAAAVENGYGMELDVQFSSDKKLLVFHDDTLNRMTGTEGWVRDYTYDQICHMPLAHSNEHAPLFSEVLQTVDGKTPLIVEIKSRHEYTGKYLDALCHATLDALKDYTGPYCIESFDPRVVYRIRKFAPQVLRGQLVDSYHSYCNEGAHPIHAFVISHCFGNFMARPDFIAWCPEKQNWAVRLCDRLGAMMVMWTALPEHDQSALEKQYDAVIFQWYHPQIQYK